MITLKYEIFQIFNDQSSLSYNNIQKLRE